MKTQKAISLAGGHKALADLFGITQSAVSQWGDDIPEGREWQLRVIKPDWFKPAKWDGKERRQDPRPDHQHKAGA